MGVRPVLVTAVSAVAAFSLLVPVAAPATAAEAVPRLVTTGLDGSLFHDGSVALGDQIYWIVADQQGGELWTSDGTAPGTHLLKDINPGPGSSQVSSLMRFGAGLLFTANDGVHGRELWHSDGTAAGTAMVADLDPRTDSNGGTSLYMVAGGVAYLCADNGINGDELYRYSGAGSPNLVDLNTTSRTTDVDVLKFDWRADWTSSYPSGFVRLGDSVLFTADDTLHSAVAQDGSWYIKKSGHGRELWISGPGGTRLVKDITAVNAWGDPDTTASTDFDRSPAAVLGGVAYFVITARHSIGGELRSTADLWRSDGTTGGTAQVAVDLPLSYNQDQLRWDFDPAVAGGKIFYPAWTEASSYDGMWATSGAGRGARVGPAGDAGDPVALGGSVVYSFSTGLGIEPWISDGSTAAILKDIRPGAQSSIPFPISQWGDQLYFGAASDTGRDLWRTDGTTTGTVKVYNLPEEAGAVVSGPIAFAPAQTRLYFWHSTTNVRHLDNQLWYYDPSAQPEPATMTTTVLTAPEVIPFGAARDVTIVVRGEGIPTGTVTVRDGTRVLGTVALVGGRAQFALPDDLSLGVHRLTASYSGDTSHDGSTSRPVITRVKAGTKLTGNIPALKFTTKDKIVVTTRLTTTPTVKATGTEKVRLDGRVVKSAKLRVSDGNRLRFVLKKLDKGVHTLQVTFDTSDNAMDARTGTVKFKIKRG